MELRVARGTDTEALVALYDEAVAWLAARGRVDQWGTTPFSARPETTALIRSRAESGDMWVAESKSRILGGIVLGSKAPHYIDPRADGPEIYVGGMITSRSCHARGLGRVLLAHARDTARRAGISLLRMDCYAGGDGALVAYYESVGFSQIARFTVDLAGSTYSGCLLEQHLTARS